jgi:hypothetical protein
MALAGAVALPMTGLALKLALSFTNTEDLNLEGTVAGYLDMSVRGVGTSCWGLLLAPPIW